LSKKFLLTLAMLIVIIGAGSVEVPVGDSNGEGIPLASGGSWNESAAGSFRVDNFNIRRSKGNDDVRDLSRSIEVLRGTDIAGLQETSGTLFYGWKDQAEQIAEALGAGFLFAPASWRWYQHYAGPALISRFPVTAWSITHLPKQEGEQGTRLLISADVVIQDRPVRILVTHLTRRDSSEMQLEHVFEQFRNSEIPTILMADLNVDETNEALQAFLNEPGVTDAVAQAIGPFWRLDWIVTKGFEVVQGDFTPRGISDHAHYWVELVFSSESLE
jgi:endonuclease/exonuclease/phosphatase family metal-dependent hydrolase